MMNESDESVAPELRPSLNALLQASRQFPPLSGANLGFYRKRAKFGGMTPLADIPYSVVNVPAQPAYRAFRLWIINASPDGAVKPVLLHFHGGGFVMGDCQNSLPRLQQLALETDTVIVSVEYGLAPEVRADEARAQHYAALEWTIAQANTLGIDKGKIGLLGVSAGGGHAALMAQQVVQKQQYQLACQLLLYPMLDDRTGSSIVPPAHHGRYLWTAEQNQYGWQAFLNKTPGSSRVPAHHVAARAASLAGLPPTYIGVGELDLFVNENINYAQRLINDGVSTRLNVVAGAFHAFESVAPQTDLARRFNETLVGAINEFMSQ
ncbi:alpha/beta hydrolase [Alteromonas gilva]|uniref:Alpha/beta hydrolase n=1 Tax=Alteromonas gilva TaxID=2987522 RepID=A0ABT5L4Q0_9ALTE|nr:alpha/beta hydrolase [Alteromonas gilva]MDC8832015.1 alpha/beta hydrolase [Alteromonas gilva]